MFKKILLSVVALLLSMTASMAQSSNEIVVEQYSKIVTTGNVHLMLLQSDETSSIITELHGITKFRYKVKKGVLYIDVPTGIFAPKGYLKVVASTPELKALEVQGAVVESLGEIVGDSFNFKTDGSVNTANLWVDVDYLTVEIDGRSDVSVRGNAQSVTLSAVLGSRIDVLGLTADNLYVKAYEAAEIYAICDGKINAKLSTDATLYWAGEAKISENCKLGGKAIFIERGDTPYLFEKYDGVEVYTSFSGKTPAEASSKGTTENKSVTNGGATAKSSASAASNANKSSATSKSEASTSSTSSSEEDFF